MNETTMPTCVFRARTRLAAPPEVVFAFHRDPRNLTVVMPPTFRLDRLETDGPAEEGRLVKLWGREAFIIPIRWTGRWRTVQPPGLLVDELIQGPFRVFVHEHRFEPDGAGGCVMTDRVTYAWGRGWWGRLVSATVVRLSLAALFAYRHARTRTWAARHAGRTGEA